MTDFNRILRELMRDPYFQKYWNQYEQMKAKVLAGEISWEDLDKELECLYEG